MNRMDLKNSVEFFLFRVLGNWLRSQSVEKALEFHKKLAWMWFEVLKIRRDVTIQNLRNAFPEKSEQEIINLARKVFLHFSRVGIEHIVMPKIIRLGIDHFIADANWEVLDRAFEQGRGVIFITGHFGNWELLGSALALKGYPFWAVAAEQRNRRVDYYINAHRRLAGMKIITRQLAKATIPQIFNENGLICLLCDQDAGKDGVFVPYFGRLASTPPGPSVYALRHNVPVVYGIALAEGGRYRFYFERLEFKRGGENIREAVQKMTAMHVQRLEQDVRRYPEQWFWMHRRWKTPPPEIA